MHFIKDSLTFFKYKGKAWENDITLFNCFREKEIILEPFRINSSGNVINIECKMKETVLFLDNIKDESDKNEKKNRERVNWGKKFD